MFRERPRLPVIAAALLGALFWQTAAHAAFRMGLPAEGYSNAGGAGLSYGLKLDEDAWFWGWSVDYSRIFSNGWLINVSVTWDEETEKRSMGLPDKVVGTYGFTAAIGRDVTDRLVIGAGLGHGLANNDNALGRYKSVKLGDDLAGGVIFSYVLWRNGRHDISPSASVEYNFNDKKWALSFDLGYGFSF